MPPVRYEQHGAVAVITLDDAATRNALSPEALELIELHALSAGSDPAVRLLVLTGADGVFCSGAAIRAWEALDESGETLTDRGTGLGDLFAQLPIPVLACLSGHAVGGGSELALATDWRIADPAAELRFVHTSLALMPGFGGLGRLERLVGPATALRLLATRAHPVQQQYSSETSLVNQSARSGQARLRKLSTRVYLSTLVPQTPTTGC